MGWYDADGEIVDKVTVSNSDVTLTAKWTHTLMNLDFSDANNVEKSGKKLIFASDAAPYIAESEITTDGEFKIISNKDRDVGYIRPFPSVIDSDHYVLKVDFKQHFTNNVAKGTNGSPFLGLLMGSNVLFKLDPSSVNSYFTRSGSNSNSALLNAYTKLNYLAIITSEQHNYDTNQSFAVNGGSGASLINGTPKT